MEQQLVKGRSKLSFLFPVFFEVCAASPWLAMAFFIALASVSRRSLGHWPLYWEYWRLLTASNKIRILNNFFGLWTLFSLLGVPMIYLIIKRGFKRSEPPNIERRKRYITTFILGWVVFIILILVDPFGFSSAFIDS
jgi:hypothetical protein